MGKPQIIYVVKHEWTEDSINVGVATSMPLAIEIAKNNPILDEYWALRVEEWQDGGKLLMTYKLTDDKQSLIPASSDE